MHHQFVTYLSFELITSESPFNLFIIFIKETGGNSQKVLNTSFIITLKFNLCHQFRDTFNT